MDEGGKIENETLKMKDERLNEINVKPKKLES
jgi:hypothetical protein